MQAPDPFPKLSEFSTIDTPALLVDLRIVENNIKKMQQLANKFRKNLRPHAKTHKIPLLAHLQTKSGARGICVQKVGEAEVFARSGIDDILISNEVLGRHKIARIFDLIGEGCKVSLAVDSTLGIRELHEVASDCDSKIDVLVEVDVGMNRCGIDPSDEKVLDSISNELSICKGVKFKGLMGYDGQSGEILDRSLRTETVKQAYSSLQHVRAYLEKKGFESEVMSVGGTPSAEIWAGLEEVTELQSGTYVFNDMLMVRLGVAEIEDIAAFVIGQVISRNRNRAVIDAGHKAVSIVSGKFPAVKGNGGLAVHSMTEEHSVLTSSGVNLPQFEERVSLLPDEIPATVDLWDKVVIVKANKLLGTLDVAARGKRS